MNYTALLKIEPNRLYPWKRAEFSQGVRHGLARVGPLGHNRLNNDRRRSLWGNVQIAILKTQRG
jgi:hypothetical protein